MSNDKPLNLYQPDGTVIKAPYDEALMTFVHEGTAIRDPFLSECGRFYTNPTYYGFEIYHTGGGCMAYRKVLEDGRYFLLTTSDGCHLPDEVEDAETATMGLYTADGEEIAGIDVADIPDPE